jgi:hypothetical protein
MIGFLLHGTSRLLALNGRGDTHQICPLLKVNRPCHLAAVTSQFDPEQTLTGADAINVERARRPQ